MRVEGTQHRFYSDEGGFLWGFNVCCSSSQILSFPLQLDKEFKDELKGSLWENWFVIMSLYWFW